MAPDLFKLYQKMLKSRLFEEAVADLWDKGKIFGEMHLGIGEEAICAGIMDHIVPGDSLALDHRGTAPLIMRGVDPLSLLLEFTGHPEGLCRGFGGHMHLFSPENLAASSGIVGASAPAGIGFALSAQYLRPGKVAVSFLGEGSMNQGMVSESLNLAVVYNLPLIFVCKDNGWSITTVSGSMTAGNLTKRADAYGMSTAGGDGTNVKEVWDQAARAIKKAREGGGPSFLHFHCHRPEGHFLGDPLVKIARHPLKALRSYAGPLIKSIARYRGGSVKQRSKSLSQVTASISRNMKEQYFSKKDPLQKTAVLIKNDKKRFAEIEDQARNEIAGTVSLCLDKLGQVKKEAEQ